MPTNRLALAGTLALAALGTALADEPIRPVTNDTYRSECGDCHMAFQPQLLPQRSWRKIMDGLSDHFGSDASIDEAVKQDLLRYLTANAADMSRGELPRKLLRSIPRNAVPLRISDIAYWIDEHDEVPAATWKDPRVVSKANCTACHTRAQEGRYEEDDLRVPGPGGTWQRWED